MGLSDIKTEDNIEHGSGGTMQGSVYIELRREERMYSEEKKHWNKQWLNDEVSYKTWKEV